MPLENVKAKNNESAVDFVINTFKSQLEKKELKPGDKIPNETELSEMLSVSRGSVREAMKILSAFGVIEILRGNGTYIRQPDSFSSIDPVLFGFLLMAPSKKEIIEFRVAIEREVLHMAVRNADESDIQNMTDNINEFKKAPYDAENAETVKLKRDLEFHHLLGKATHNGFMERIYAFVMNYYEPYLLKSYESQSEVPELSVKSHEILIEPILKRDVSIVDKAVEESGGMWISLAELA